jgi:hypothetical protein
MKEKVRMSIENMSKSGRSDEAYQAILMSQVAMVLYSILKDEKQGGTCL